MSYLPCRERTFPLWMADEFEYHSWCYAHWLRQLLERLGRDQALALWEDTFQAYNEELLVQILSPGWEEVEGNETVDMEKQVSDSLAELYPSPVEGVSAKEVKEILQNTPPFRQIQQHLPSLNVKREITTYEALHLFRDSLALLAETVVGRYGKQGELLAYDAILEEWPRSPEPRTSVEDFMSSRQTRFTSEPNEQDMFSAGLEVAFIRGSETEVVTRVTECEWARYYQERHPQVGYMLACSVDNAAYRSFNNRIRLQRTSTLMEGGTQCDFRVYDVEPIHGD